MAAVGDTCFDDDVKITVMGVIGDVIKPGRRKTRVPTAIRLWAADMATSCVWTAGHFEVLKKNMYTPERRGGCCKLGCRLNGQV